jgi:hypothetical protein
MEFNEENIKARPLLHLRRKRVMGGVHTHFDTLTKGFPSHLGKEVKKIAEKLIKNGWLITKPTSYGLQVSLNKDRLIEIDGFLERALGVKFT